MRLSRPPSRNTDELSVIEESPRDPRPPGFSELLDNVINVWRNNSVSNPSKYRAWREFIQKYSFVEERTREICAQKLESGVLAGDQMFDSDDDYLDSAITRIFNCHAPSLTACREDLIRAYSDLTNEHPQ